MKATLLTIVVLTATVSVFGQTTTGVTGSAAASSHCQGTAIPGYIPPGVPNWIQLNSLSELPSAPSLGTPPSITPAPQSAFTPPSFVAMGSRSNPGTTSGIGAMSSSGVGSIGISGVGSMPTTGVGRMGSTGIGVLPAFPSAPPSFTPPPSFVGVTQKPARRSAPAAVAPCGPVGQ